MPYEYREWCIEADKKAEDTNVKQQADQKSEEVSTPVKQPSRRSQKKQGE